MKRFDRLTAILLAALTLLSFSACGGSSDGKTAATDASVQTDSTETAELTETTAITPELPSLDFNGETYMVLTKMEGDEEGRWTAHDVYVEEQTGEVVNDAVYGRNQIIEDKYNVAIAQGRMAIGGQYSYTMYKNISKLVYAGDTTYDMVMPTIQDCAYLARDGMLYDLNSIGNVDLSKPWWNAQFTSDTVIGGKNYFGDGDICMTFMRAVYTILFDKQIIEDYSLENPYDVVNDGRWTIDKLLEMGAVFSSDINGDGVLDDSDNTGLIVLNNQVEALYTASGEKMVTENGDGTFSFNGDSERSINVLEKIYNLYEDSETVLCATDTTRRSSETKSLGHVEAAAAAFSAGRNLFLLGTMNNVPSMRDMETDFGILPLPKGTDAQENYYSYVQTWASGCAAITITVSNTEKSSVILEEMAYQSQQITTPAYYEVALKTKYARDVESSAMLDLIYDSRTCDLGNLFNIGNLVSGITELIYPKHKDTFVSFIESKREAIEATLTEMSEMYNA